MLIRRVLLGTTVAGVLVSSLLWGHMERMKKNELEDEKGRIFAALESSEHARTQENWSAQQIHKTSEKYHEELQAARNELDRLERDNSVVVRVNADCPRMPEDDGSASGDNAGTARLGEDAKRDYYNLRREMKRQEQQIVALQAYARECHKLTNQK